METAAPGVCDGGGGTARYDEQFFPRKVDEYCIDPHGETRAYGHGVEAGLDDVCVQLFNGECEVYKRYGLERVTTLRYVDGGVVDGRGSAASVAVTLSRFARRSGAYGFFTKRVLGDGDPLSASVEPMEAGGAAALGGGIAYVWRGSHVLELTYTNEIEAPEQLRASSARVLPGLAREIGERIPGDKEPLPEVRLLPEEHRVALGVQFEERLLDLPGAGEGAIGHYRDGDRRWRVLVAIREDEQSSADLLRTLRQGGQGWPSPIKQQRAVKVRFAAQEDQPSRVWIFARRNHVVIGVGDERFPPPSAGSAVHAGDAGEDGSSLSFDLSERRKLELLTELATAVERLPATPLPSEM